MSQPNTKVPAFIGKKIEFSDGTCYEIHEPLTDFRSCHDGTPAESRIVVLCRRTSSNTAAGDGSQFVMKIKVQIHSPSRASSQEPHPGPSTTTSAELKALKTFTGTEHPSTPQLVAWKSDVQSAGGPMPGGYINYMIITKMPGRNLLDIRFWDMTDEQRGEIRGKFLTALRSIHTLGIEPIDRGLRNVLWDQETQKCSVIDFELWLGTQSADIDADRELERWGLVKRPPPRSWWAAWNMQER